MATAVALGVVTRSTTGAQLAPANSRSQNVFQTLVVASTVFPKQRAAGRSNNQLLKQILKFAGVCSCCLQLLASCRHPSALSDRCDLSEQVKNVMSASMPWHADTESVETDQLDVLHHLASAPDNSTHHDQVNI